MPFVVYTGKKTAFYSNQSYFPGEVFEVPETIIKKIKGKDTELPFTFSDNTALRLATDNEVQGYLKSKPARLAAYNAAKTAAKKGGRSRAADPAAADAARRSAAQDALEAADAEVEPAAG